MHNRMVIAIICLQAVMGLAAPAAEARNRYRVERIYRLVLQPGETCERAWLAHHGHRSADPDPIDGAGSVHVRFGVSSFVTRDGRRCTVTVFSISDRID